MRTITSIIIAFLLLVCLSVPTVASSNVLRLSIADPYVKPGEFIDTLIDQLNLTQPIGGFQAFLSYDSQMISLVSNNVSFTAQPYSLTIFKTVNGANVDLAAGIDVFSDKGPSSADETLADLKFVAGSTEGRARIGFRSHEPPTMFSDMVGDIVAPVLIDAPEIVIDGTAPVITSVPTDITVPNDPGQWSAQVNTGTPTATDNLSSVGSIVGTRSDGLPITSPYPVGLTTIRWTVSDRSGNTSRCFQRVVVYAVGIIEPVIADPYVKPGEPVYVSLYQSALLQPSTGFQAFLAYDSSMMSISKADIALTSVPYGLQILKSVSGSHIDLAAGINTFTGQDPTWDDATIATMRFTVDGREGITYVTFRDDSQPSLFTDLEGNPIFPALRNSVPIVVDGTAPQITPPPDIYINAAAGATGANVNVGVATSVDSLSGVASVTGIRSDGQPLNALYPIGGTEITWISVDRSGNSASAKQIIVVAPAGFQGTFVKTVAAAKQLADGSGVALVSPVETRAFGALFYVEDVSRTAGVLVNQSSGSAPLEGRLPAIFGTIKTIAGERVIDSATVAPYLSSGTVTPLGMVAKSAETGLAQGLYVTLCGRAEVKSGATQEFVLQDGSPAGIRIRLYGVSLPGDGAFVIVTGTIGADAGSPTIRVNKSKDLVQVVH